MAGPELTIRTVFSSLAVWIAIFVVVIGGVLLGVLATGGFTFIQRNFERPSAVTQPVADTPARQEAAAAPEAQPEPEPEPARLTIHRVSSVPAQPDPFDPIWFDATAVDIPLEPQMLAVPMLMDATVETARVRAVTDGRRIAWQLSWLCDKPAYVSNTGTYPDAAGLQFPLDPNASYMMGGPDMPVHVLYWRAQWQKDIDERFQDVYAMYPNFWACGYWFAEGDFPPRVPEAFSDVRSHEWFVAYQAGNPMADFHRTSPVDEMTAEGHGSLTYLPEATADGRGAWRDGRWHVVFVRPIGNDDLSKQFRPGSSGQFGVAVWDGAAGNVGGRKHHSYWYPFEVEQ